MCWKKVSGVIECNGNDYPYGCNEEGCVLRSFLRYAEGEALAVFGATFDENKIDEYVFAPSQSCGVQVRDETTTVALLYPGFFNVRCLLVFCVNSAQIWFITFLFQT